MRVPVMPRVSMQTRVGGVGGLHTNGLHGVRAVHGVWWANRRANYCWCQLLLPITAAGAGHPMGPMTLADYVGTYLDRVEQQTIGYAGGGA